MSYIGGSTFSAVAYPVQLSKIENQLACFISLSFRFSVPNHLSTATVQRTSSLPAKVTLTEIMEIERPPLRKVIFHLPHRRKPRLANRQSLTGQDSSEIIAMMHVLPCRATNQGPCPEERRLDKTPVSVFKAKTMGSIYISR